MAHAAKKDMPAQLVPRLRFPEFTGEGEWEWEGNILGAYSCVVRGGSPRPINDFLTIKKTGLNWLKIGDIDKEAKYVVGTTEKVRFEALSKTREISPGDLILSNSMSFGRPYISKIKACIHDGWLAITKIRKILHIEYIYYLISSPFPQQYFENNAAGSGVQNLNADIIKALPIFFPNILEQQRIADCLSSLDERIAAEANKLDTLKTHKNGLLKQLFPAEGETLPQLRFPEFIGSEAWICAQMADIYAFKRNNSFSRDMLNYNVGNVKNIHYGDIHTKFSSHFYVQNENVPFVNCDIDLDNISKECFCSAGDIIFADASEDMKDIGKCIEIIFTNEERILSGLHTILARQRKDILVVGFGGHLFHSPRVRTQIQKEAQGAKILGLSFGRLAKIQICFPLVGQEQQRIADCLSSLDEIVTAHVQKIDLLKAHKKGLMQQLFPTIDEVQA